ncbi:hypothetical protein HW130_13565 [Streptomyces sp. PKU-EA00015]|uniref:hypothetical protein n=1 Tax=Streptomyces sp. PKU-EA00015 TaxID=2748326 RepID=UPI0015A2E0BB|nr:hypothetical protein [Streptomyces sp. PKU-EA00015]NWF27290.1 hypothetical protein [Streptomyces sp. PKU-EA00015]
MVPRKLERGRPDDTEDVIRHRQRVYERHTAPLLDHYADTPPAVQAVGPVDEIAERALKGLARPA